ncbi:hypothetical protein SELMODRAFT_403219 [Selaginella moellendorffii]|uniref:FAD-binding domain-containing protein n=1 Tax=Selaginella moellendorffii TaxID=88036 RepID=D8QTG4_SELML|nr:hypothetical protein SELMODRAFT_403219 [Selaginella moellendorffii]
MELMRSQPRLSVGLSAAIKSVASLTKTTKVTFCGSRNGAGDETLVTTYGEDELYVVKWRSARSILASRVPARYIHCSHVLLDYFLDDQSVALRFQCGGEVTIIRAKFVVGADGINSAVRRAMYPADRPWDLHLINWNALVHNPGRFSVHDPDQIAITRSGGPSICYLVGAGEDYTLWVFRVEDRSTAKESSGGFCDESGKARVLEEIDKLLGSSPAWEPLKIAVEATEAGQIFQRRIKDRIPLESWSNLDQRWCSWAMLLSPALAAGNPEDLKRAVMRYEELRIPRLTKFQNYAAETTCIADFIPAWATQLTPSDQRCRMKEFQHWAASYPLNMTGDPDSTYFNSWKRGHFKKRDSPEEMIIVGWQTKFDPLDKIDKNSGHEKIHKNHQEHHPKSSKQSTSNGKYQRAAKVYFVPLLFSTITAGASKPPRNWYLKPWPAC